MPSAEIITIGTEILLGEILDTNAQYIARALRDLGIDLYRKTTVGDNQKRIAQVLQQAMERCDIIITTGGLGPTVDDPTREAVALAAGLEVEFRPELWEQIQARFRRFGRNPTENNKRQAYIPKGSRAIENPVGTAPAFVVEAGGAAIIALPGVPREMEHLMENFVLPYLREQFDLDSIIKSRILHTSGVGESQIDDLIGDLETLENPTVALAAHSGRVDVRITAKAGSEVEADEKIQWVEQVIRQRLGKWIYGSDQDTLEAAALRRLEHIGWTLVAVEVGLGGELLQRLAAVPGPFRGGEVLAEQPTPQELAEFTDAFRQARHADVGFGAAVLKQDAGEEIHFVLITPQGKKQYARSYVGPPGNAPVWAINHGLDMIRGLLIKDFK
ncbi:MAG TPA: CinA family nicotinamide mononucleotide deamidase-related protein [Anaerolineales bacterium]|jgi:competence/damage-inducible protein CinA-like protein